MRWEELGDSTMELYKEGDAVLGMVMNEGGYGWTAWSYRGRPFLGPGQKIADCESKRAAMSAVEKEIGEG